MKLKGKEIQIGMFLTHGPAYPMTCSERFPNIYSEADCISIGRESKPMPLDRSGTGYVIGLRMAIMDEYKYKAGVTYQSLEDPYPEHIPSHATGKREMCLVMTAKIKPFKPYLVRMRDVA